MKWIPLIGLWFSRKEDKHFFGQLILVNIGYTILAGFIIFFLNLPIFQP